MGSIQFVENYQDLSTDKGYQFKFHCDRCGNGYLSTFETNPLGVAGGFLQAAGSLLGGVFGKVAESTYDIQKAIGGPAHDSAVRKAVEEIKVKFHQCKHCAKWVCPEVCWNAERSQCIQCAPNLGQEVASAQAQASRDQAVDKIRKSDQLGDADVTKKGATTACAGCGADVGTSKFCPECGKPVLTLVKCGDCGAEMKSSAKFCPECGKPHHAA